MTDPVQAAETKVEDGIVKVEVAAKDAVSVAQHVKSELEKLGATFTGLEVRIVADVSKVWTRFDMWIVGVGGGILGAILKAWVGSWFHH